MKMSEANLIKKTEKESQKDLLEILSNDMDHLEKVIELKTICQINQEILTKQRALSKKKLENRDWAEKNFVSLIEKLINMFDDLLSGRTKHPKTISFHMYLKEEHRAVLNGVPVWPFGGQFV